MNKNKVELGDKVKDAITGYQGVVMGITAYITGCDHVAVLSQTKKKDDGKPVDWVWFDITRLAVVKKNVVKLPKEETAQRKPGGPQPEAPQR